MCADLRDPHCRDFSLVQLRACGYQSLACLVGGVLVEVLDEAACQVFCLLGPLCSVCIGVAGIEDLGINTRKLGRNLEVEDRNVLGRSLLDRTVEDSVDDTCLLYTSDAADE